MKCIDSYIIRGLLGRGGMDKVLQVEVPIIKRILALKLLAPVDTLVSLIGQERIVPLFTEEAIAIANDSRFGLVSYGWTENMNVALKLQESIRAGTVWINTPLLRDLRAPFGGFKDSGIGRDGPRQCAEFYTEEKAAIFARGKAPIRRLGSA